jgi:enoyl-CoA hydratase/carnithine racemase
MSEAGGTVEVTRRERVAIIEFARPPLNFFDLTLIRQIADAVEALDHDDGCRAIVLAAAGKVFCAGMDFHTPGSRDLASGERPGHHLYKEARRLIGAGKPIVAAIHGAAVGGGLGLALAADSRVTCREARFSANFNRLGIHPGFGLSVTLPRLVGQQQAALLLFTGRRIDGAEAVRIGLADELVVEAQVRSAAEALAAEMAASAPLALRSTRDTLRRGLVEAFERATERELLEQNWQLKTEDFAEGVRAMNERRLPDFTNR